MRSIRFKIIAFISALLGLLLILLNTYPIMASRDRVFQEKKNALSAQTVVVASSLSSLENPGQESIGDVLKLLDISGFDRIVAVDSEGVVLYDDRGSEGGRTDISALMTALSGKSVFRSSFTDSAFVSSCAIPMYSKNVVSGAVYIREYDRQQAEMILSIQGRIRALSLIIAVAAVLMTMLFSNVLLHRMQELV